MILSNNAHSTERDIGRNTLHRRIESTGLFFHLCELRLSNVSFLVRKKRNYTAQSCFLTVSGRELLGCTALTTTCLQFRCTTLMMWGVHLGIGKRQDPSPQ